MHDDQLKKLLLSEPSPQANQEFQIKIHHQLNLLSIENDHIFRVTNNTVAQEMRSYWQYLVMALMTAMTVLVLTHHQKTDHIDDELANLTTITELTLSTL